MVWESDYALLCDHCILNQIKGRKISRQPKNWSCLMRFVDLAEILFSLWLGSSLGGTELEKSHNLWSIHSTFPFLEDKFPQHRELKKLVHETSVAKWRFQDGWLHTRDKCIKGRLEVHQIEDRMKIVWDCLQMWNENQRWANEKYSDSKFMGFDEQIGVKRILSMCLEKLWWYLI